MRRILALILTFALLCLSTSAMPAAKKKAKAVERYTVVIDPGHGGKDIGCRGKKGREKDITLAVAKLLGEKIEKSLSDKLDVVYTRNTDRYLTLQERADVANNANGNLFISIHVNSVDKKNKKRTTIHGTSVYTCGLHKSDNSLNVAMRENSVMELEPDYTETYQGFDPDSSESYIIFELSQNLHMQQSVKFASLAQNRLIKTAGRSDMEVRQAGFWVLWATAMPSVLVELDFICNPRVEDFLTSKAGQEKCAQALYEAVKDYYSQIDN